MSGTKGETCRYSSIAKSMKVSKNTVRNVMIKFLNTGTMKRRQGSGRKINSGDRNLVREVDRSLQQNPSTSVRDLAKKFNSSKSNVFKIKKKLGYKSYRVQKCPNRREKQDQNARKRALKLYCHDMTGKKRCIMVDNESYLKTDFRQMPGHHFYSRRVGRFINSKYMS